MSSDPQTRYARGLDVCETLSGSKEAGLGMAQFFESRGAIGGIALPSLLPARSTTVALLPSAVSILCDVLASCAELVGGSLS